MAQHCTRHYNCHWQKKQKTTIMLIRTHSSIHFGSNANTKTLIKVFFPWISLFLPHFGHSNQLKSYRIPPENTQFNLTHTKCPKMKLLSSILLILIDFLQIKENFLSSIYQQKTSPVNYSELHKSLCNFQSKHFFIVFLDSLFVTNWKFFFFSQFLDRSGWLHFVRWVQREKYDTKPNETQTIDFCCRFFSLHVCSLFEHFFVCLSCFWRRQWNVYLTQLRTEWRRSMRQREVCR